ncbi:MAG: hypothetical protein ABIQ74_10725 [Chitinophagales bacterium]
MLLSTPLNFLFRLHLKAIVCLEKQATSGETGRSHNPFSPLVAGVQDELIEALSPSTREEVN